MAMLDDTRKEYEELKATSTRNEFDTPCWCSDGPRVKRDWPEGWLRNSNQTRGPHQEQCIRNQRHLRRLALEITVGGGTLRDNFAVLETHKCEHVEKTGTSALTWKQPCGWQMTECHECIKMRGPVFAILNRIAREVGEDGDGEDQRWALALYAEEAGLAQDKTLTQHIARKK